MSNTANTALVIGGTGAQGIPVVKALASGLKYTVRVLTRDSSSEEAKELAAIPGVSIFEGETHEPTLREAFKDISYVFANTNGFAIGEQAEIYWGIRLYELAREFGVKHFLYAGLEYASKLGNFDPKYRTGHLDRKGKVVDYLSAQPTTPMAWSVLTSCLYVEGLSEILRPFPDPNDPDTMVFAVPLGDGKCPLIYLEDYGAYARWILDNPSQSNGLELHVATEDIAWKDVAAAFTAVTGKKAVYKDVTLDEYFQLGVFPNPDVKLGHSAVLMILPSNLSKRDYQLLDETLPTRVKSVREWMEKTGYTGKPASVLKDHRAGKV
ncbi:uncharacterized protein CDV56_101423 [Aspergillus thermomutatus]|uniref:NmrA-like domain-containing protein n=1 Tax=Aspergillus thermomutatus TaxID=41047 RepID=A0A397H863_ASPTH|nr:uncharacterized protein CDV56_101423 [Aspergillus thermomutatus]RHZ59242.1 hypothetical protein CDV56_101423 [Aspergillus thermomutatus]